MRGLPDFPPFATDWSIVELVSEKAQGRVWRVRRPTPQGWQWGYFKYAGPEHRYYAGPMVANEWLAAAILRRLRLPAARVVPARIGELEGIVSVAPEAETVRQWRELEPKERARHLRLFRRPSGLYGMIVFDIWTTNIDRGRGKNLIVYRRPGERKYRYRLIDHALALHGSYYKWDHYGPWRGRSWQRPWRVYHAPEGLKPTARRLRPWVRRIQALPASWLERLVRSVPRRFLSRREAAFITRLLIVRQRQLHRLVRRWLRHYRR